MKESVLSFPPFSCPSLPSRAPEEPSVPTTAPVLLSCNPLLTLLSLLKLLVLPPAPNSFVELFVGAVGSELVSSMSLRRELLSTLSVCLRFVDVVQEDVLVAVNRCHEAVFASTLPAP